MTARNRKSQMALGLLPPTPFPNGAWLPPGFGGYNDLPMMKKYASSFLALSLCLTSIGQAAPALAANVAGQVPVARPFVGLTAAQAPLGGWMAPAGIAPLLPSAPLSILQPVPMLAASASVLPVPAALRARPVSVAPVANTNAAIMGSIRQALPPEAASTPEKASDPVEQSLRLHRLYDFRKSENSAEPVSAAAGSSPRAARPLAASSSERPAAVKPALAPNSDASEPVLRPEPRPKNLWPKVGIGVAVGAAVAVVALHGLFPFSLAYGALTGWAVGYTISGRKHGDPRYDPDSDSAIALVLFGGLAISVTALVTGMAVVPSFLSLSAGALSGTILGFLGHRRQFLKATHGLFPSALPYRKGSIVSEAQKKLVSSFLDGKPSDSQILDVLRDLERPQGEWLLQELVARAKTSVEFVKAVELQQTLQSIEYRTWAQEPAPAGPYAYMGDWSTTHSLNTFLITNLYTRSFWNRFIASNPSFDRVMEMRRHMADTLYYEEPPTNDSDRAWHKPLEGKSKAIMIAAAMESARNAAQFLEALGRSYPEEALSQNLDIFAGLKPTLAEWASLLPAAKSLRNNEAAARIKSGALGRVRTPQDYLSIAPFIDAIEGFPFFLAARPERRDIESQLMTQVGSDYRALAAFALRALPLTGTSGDYIKVVDALHRSVPDREKYLVYVKTEIEATLGHFESLHPTQEDSDALAKVL